MKFKANDIIRHLIPYTGRRPYNAGSRGRILKVIDTGNEETNRYDMYWYDGQRMKNSFSYIDGNYEIDPEGILEQFLLGVANEE